MNWSFALGLALSAWALLGALFALALLQRTGRIDGLTDDAPAGVEQRTGVPLGDVLAEVVQAFLLAPVLVVAAVCVVVLGPLWVFAQRFACNRFGHRGVLADGGVRCTFCTTWLVRPGQAS